MRAGGNIRPMVWLLGEDPKRIFGSFFFSTFDFGNKKSLRMEIIIINIQVDSKRYYQHVDATK